MAKVLRFPDRHTDEHHAHHAPAFAESHPPAYTRDTVTTQSENARRLESRFRVGDWLVEPRLNRLSRDRLSVQLELKALNVLLCLVHRAGEPVEKRDILDEVWQSEFVADNTLTRRIAQLREAFGDDARNPRYIETIPKRGYRLLAKVHWGEHEVTGAFPAILSGGADQAQRPIFVARETELARLDGKLEDVLDGRGTVAFVTGEAGTGKTALVGELCRRVQERHSDLVVAAGACNAATGAGDPYGPWRQVLAQLAGDVEGRVVRGALSAAAGRRLWESLPIFAKAIVASGRDLVETLIDGRGLTSRGAAAAPDAGWLDELEALVQRKLAEPPDLSLQQGAVFSQIVRVLRRVAEKVPILVVLEDLHWTDSASAGLLCDLGRQLDGSSIMVVGSFRPEEVSVGRDDGDHPLTPVIGELRRALGDLEVPVGASGEREFVDALVDSEENRLDGAFRRKLFDHTRGHALFTVEVLRTLQDREMMVRDGQDRWTATDRLDWSILPARAEGVICARVDRLDRELKDLLTIAGVEGEDFTAEVLARVSGLEVRDTIRLLSRGLAQGHRLVSARGVQTLASGKLSVFGFAHVLFQRYVYASLDDVERAQLHEDVGTALETIYGEDCDEVANELARHFEEAGLKEKAVHFLHRAGQLAVQKAACAEAVGHFRRALELLAGLPASSERDLWELATQMALCAPLISTQGWGSDEVARAAEGALELSDRVKDDELVGSALWFLMVFHACRADYRRADDLGERVLEIAEARGDEVLRETTKWLIGVQAYYQGDFLTGREYLQEVVEWYDVERHSALGFFCGVDPGVACLAHLSIVLLTLGFPDTAAARLREAEELAQRLGHQHSKTMPLWLGMAFHGQTGNLTALRRVCDRLLDMATRNHFPVQTLFARVVDAILRAVESPSDHATAEISGLWATLNDAHYLMNGSSILHLSASEYAFLGQIPEALAAFDTALAFIEVHHERVDESRVLTGKGRFLASISEAEAAEACLVNALEVARAQRARYCELEAATTLARLWHEQGKTNEARELLCPVYDWFTEGFDTVPLQEAKALLGKLEGQEE